MFTFISIKYIILLIFVTCFNALAQMMKATSIPFDVTTCSSFWNDYTNTNIMACPINAYLGTPKQTQTVLFVLNNPLPFQLNGISNAIINNQCSILTQCPYAQNAQGKDKSFYSELKSRTNQIVGGEFIQMQFDRVLVKGTFESDQFYLFSNDQPITLSFLSISQFDYYNYVGNGVIDLSRSNTNNLFSIGYQQQKLISPKFTISLNGGNSASLQFNQVNEELESVPAVPTRSSDNWDGQIIGFYYGDDDVITYAHYQTFEVQIVTQIYLPWQVATYLQKRYPDYYSQEEGMYYQLINCDYCSCLQYSPFEPIKVYTQEYLFTWKPEDYFFVAGQPCQVYIASGNLILGTKEIDKFRILFDPLEGTLQFPGAILMQHPEINSMYPIIGLSSLAFILLVWIIIYAELNISELRKEDSMIKKYL